MVTADSDVQIYVNAMARVRERINLIQTVNVNQINMPSTTFKAEIMFLQFRKVLEEIAFSTIAPNKDAYSTLHANRRDRIFTTRVTDTSLRDALLAVL